MKIIQAPEKKIIPKWSAKVECTGVCEPYGPKSGCDAILLIEETDLFSVETRMGLQAQFKCPLCEVLTEYLDYPSPAVLPPYEAWLGLTEPIREIWYKTYESPYNDYHVIHLSDEGARLFYLAQSGTSKPTIQVMNVSFLENGVEQFHATRKLLDAEAYKVFRDPKYPLNGLSILDETNHWCVRQRLEEKLEAEFSETFIDKAIRLP